jgi:hypothetical protein
MVRRSSSSVHGASLRRRCHESPDGRALRRFRVYIRVLRGHAPVHSSIRKTVGVTVDAANEFMPSFIEDYNRRFGKLPRDRHDAHRPVREDEDLDLTFSWHEARKVTSNLTLQYERKIYMLADNSENRRLIGKYIDVLQFPDGRIEIRAAGVSLPYSMYDKLGAVDQGAIVDNKRLGHVMQFSQEVQSKRDSRAVNAPSTAHRADGQIVPRHKLAGTKTQRELGPEDLEIAIQSKASIAQTQRRLREAGLLPAKAAKNRASNALRASDRAVPATKNMRVKRILGMGQMDIST